MIKKQKVEKKRERFFFSKQREEESSVESKRFGFSSVSKSCRWSKGLAFGSLGEHGLVSFRGCGPSFFVVFPFFPS